MIPVAELMCAQHDPEQLIALDRHQRYSWQMFKSAVAALCTTLAQQPSAEQCCVEQQSPQPQPAQRWLLHSNNTYQFAVGLMALLYSGKTVFLPVNAQPATLAEWSAHCDGMLGVEGGLSIPVQAIPVQADSLSADGSVNAETESISETGFDIFKHPLDANVCAIEVHTSGSTGQAQVISKPLRCFQSEVMDHSRLWQQQLADATVFATVSHQHIYGLLWRLLVPLCCGRPFWAEMHQYPEQLVADIRDLGEAAVIVSSPAHLSRLPERLDFPEAPFSEMNGSETNSSKTTFSKSTFSKSNSQVRLITSSGGPLSLAAASDTHKKLGQLPVEVFGSTETGGVAWRQQAAADQPWSPLAGVELDADPDNGQLRVHSVYCPDPHGFTMGDVVNFLDDGRFQLRGRADRIVKIEGKRLSLTAMEKHLKDSPLVAEAKVLTLEGARQQLAAVVELTEEGRQWLDVDGKLALNNHFKHYLLEHYERPLLPRKWRYPETMPVNSQGKLPLADLQALFGLGEVGLGEVGSTGKVGLTGEVSSTDKLDSPGD